MPERILQLDDIRNTTNIENLSGLFQRLGYRVFAAPQPIDVEDLQLSPRSTEAIAEAYLVADHPQRGLPSLQVLLCQLTPEEWISPSIASLRMRAISTALARKPSNYLLVATDRNYDRLMLVNPRKSLDAQGNVKTNIRKLLIDRTNPTPYDRDRLEAIAVRNLNPLELYKAHCEAFDVEKLTKVFYNGYRELFGRVKIAIRDNNPDPYFNDSARLHQFSQRLLGRIMFIYFLQKKEFLAGDRRFLSRQYESFCPDPQDTNYYSEILEPLFFETLNQPRPNFESRFGKIPYLNGGLFDRDYGEGIKDTGGRETPRIITLPNSLFDRGELSSILGFFNSYNFTISENVQGDEDVAVDPEMLGKVFENMLEAEERGKSGTFYTPRGIVNFMCVEVLSRYLADATGMTPDAVRELIELDPDLPDTEFQQKITPVQAKALKKAIAEAKILDPAVGSGAFPLGMMQVILAVRQAIGRREGETIRRGSLRMSEVKREIIANNLYGVDIKPEAIEVAKLRMWLSLVVDIPSIDDVEALPNLDYKLMCGDSLISTIHGEQLIPDPTKTQQVMLLVTPIQDAIQPLVALQQRYYSAQTDERKVLRQQIIEAEANVFRVATSDRRGFWVDEQRKLEADIKRLGKVSRIQERKSAEIAVKLAELDKFAEEVERGDRALSFFNYHLHFRDVFEKKGGFDIVVGNPPYVRQEAIKELKPSLEKEFDCYVGRADIFIYFYERGFRLIREGGHLTYITSNKYFRSGYGEKLRKFLGEQSTVQTLIDFGDASVFEAIAYPSIIVFSKEKPTKETLTQVLTWEQTELLDNLPRVFKSKSFAMPQIELKADTWRIESPAAFKLIEKLQKSGLTLGKYVNAKIYLGVKTGLNEAFIIGRETRDRLIAEHPSSAEVLKPFLRGRDVKRWCVDYADQYIIFANRGIEIERYPAIYDYLEQYRELLESRATINTHPWYELQQPQEGIFHFFDKPKIIYPNICKRNEFTWDELGYYTNQKTFIIPCEDKDKVLLAILNSSVFTFLFDKLLAKLQGGFFEPNSSLIKDFPIPISTESDSKTIESLVQKCLDAKGQGVEQWEAEINDRVAHLYGLTADEMKIIRGEKLHD